jgi:5'-hydroxyaverantin dehydrogenase
LKPTSTNFNSQLSAFKNAISFSPHNSIDVAIPCAGVAGDLFLTDPEAPSLDRDPSPPPTRGLEVNLIGVFYSAYLAFYYFRIPSPTAHKALKSLGFISP